MNLKSGKARWPLRILITLVALVTGLSALVYAITDHPKPEQPAEVVCPSNTASLGAGQQVKVLSWNVQYLAGRDYVFFYDTLAGDGPDTRPSPASIARTLSEVVSVIKAENPDVVMLQEVDRFSKRTDNQDQLQLIKDALDGVYPCTSNAYYHKSPFVPHPKIMGKVGLTLSTLSKTKIESAIRYQLPKICGDPVTVAFNFKRAILSTQLSVEGGKPFSVIHTHMDAFAQGCDTMKNQVARVQQVLGDTPQPWLMGGDFNLLGTKAAYDRLQDREKAYFNSQTEMASLLAQYQSFPSPTQINSGDSKFFTHFPNDPAIGKPDRTIDYLLYSAGLQHSGDKVRQDSPKISDHFALMTIIKLP